MFFFFHRLFEENADLLSLFTKFQTLKTKDSQISSMELAEHASRVMTSLDESINLLDKVDMFIEYLYAIGQDHRKIPGFKKEYFWVRYLFFVDQSLVRLLKRNYLLELTL